MDSKSTESTPRRRRSSIKDLWMDALTNSTELIKEKTEANKKSVNAEALEIRNGGGFVKERINEFERIVMQITASVEQVNSTVTAAMSRRRDQKMLPFEALVGEPGNSTKMTEYCFQPITTTSPINAQFVEDFYLGSTVVYDINFLGNTTAEYLCNLVDSNSGRPVCLQCGLHEMCEDALGTSSPPPPPPSRPSSPSTTTAKTFSPSTSSTSSHSSSPPVSKSMLHVVAVALFDDVTARDSEAAPDKNRILLALTINVIVSLPSCIEDQYDIMGSEEAAGSTSSPSRKSFGTGKVVVLTQGIESLIFERNYNFYLQGRDENGISTEDTVPNVDMDTLCSGDGATTIEEPDTSSDVLSRRGLDDGNGVNGAAADTGVASPTSCSSYAQHSAQLRLHEAISQRNAGIASELITLQPQIVRCVDARGRTALHIACKEGSADLVSLLVQRGANVNAQDVEGHTCLHFVQDLQIMELLLKNHANPNLENDQKLTALHLHVMAGETACVRLLLQHLADPTLLEHFTGQTCIHMAASMGSFDLLALLLLELPPYLIQKCLNCPDLEGNTPVHLLAKNTNACGQQQKGVLLLLDKGASPLITNHLGISPLHFVCANRYLCDNGLAEPLVSLLIDLGSDPNAMDNDGCTPLVVACAHREWGICRILFEAGGDMNLPCSIKSFLLRQCLGGSSRLAAAEEVRDCTASDLMPRKVRISLFGLICAQQTCITSATRDRCMNCAKSFDPRQNEKLSLFSMQRFRLTSGKHHCRHCCRVVCQECSSQSLPLQAMPEFIQQQTSKSTVRVCNVCFAVLTNGLPSQRSSSSSTQTSYISLDEIRP